VLDELRPLGLSDAARALGVDPFEVVRLTVAFGPKSGPLTLSLDQVAELRDHAGIEDWWTDASLPDDGNRLRAAIRGAIHQLISRRLVGEQTTRLDNLWRGLAVDQQVGVEQAVMVLLEEEKLLTAASPRGVQVSIAPGAETLLDKIASGAAEHAGLAAVWQGS